MRQEAVFSTARPGVKSVGNGHHMMPKGSSVPKEAAFGGV